MKTLIKYLLSILISALLFNAVLFASSSFNFPGSSQIEIFELKAEDGVIYDHISLEGIFNEGQPGEPELPVECVNLIIPSDQTAVNVRLISSTEKEYILEKPLFPAQHDRPTTDREITIPFVPPKSEIYQSAVPYPDKIVKIIGHNWFDGDKHIVTLAISPVRYFPKENKIILYTDVQYEIEYSSGAKGAIHIESRSAKQNDFYNELLKNIVSNPDDIPATASSGGLSKISSGPLPFYEYVIITSNAFENSFTRLLDWKKRKGLDAGIVTVEDILSNYTTDHISGITDDAGAIRQYLYDAYTDGTTVFALMGGDYNGGYYNYVPIRYGCGSNNTWTSFGISGANKIPADLYFCDFNGDWDVDGDVYTGEESDDNPDYGPEIFVGRLLCTSETDILNWTEKVILYEQNPGRGDISYLTNSFMIASDQLTGEPDSVKSHFPSSFTHEVWKELPSGGAPNPTFPFGNEVVTEMNTTPYAIWSWFGHGSPISTVCKAHLYNKDIPTKSYLRAWDNLDVAPGANEPGNGMDNLNNANHPALVYSLACENMPFDDFCTNSGQRNLAEAFTSMFSGGGPAFLGNTRFGWIGISYKLYQKFADLLTAGGANLHLGVAEAVSCQNNTSMKHYLSYSHNLVGCPETKMWTQAPSFFAGVTVTDGGTYLTVDAGVSDCDISVCSLDNGQSYHLLASGVSSYTFTTSVRPIYVTISKSNYLPFVGITGGSISNDITFSGKIQIIDDITITNNKILTVEDGANILLDSDARITIETGSKLIANGTENDPIKFTSINSNPSMSDWFGIRVYGEADINHTTVEYAWNGIKFETGATGSVSNSTFTDNYYGIYINSAEPTVQNCVIEDNKYGLRIFNSYSSPNWNTIHFSGNTILENSYYGLYFYNSSPTLSSNAINSNGRSTLWSGSNPILDDNDFKNSTYYGLACYGNCSPSMYVNGSLGGHNTIIYNGAQGIRITGSSDPILGRLNPSMGGYNSIYSNSGYEIDNTTSNSIMAMHNWWGSPDGPGSDYTGSVWWQPPLSYDPNDPLKILAGDFSVDPNSDLPLNLQRAYYEQSKQNYAAAAEGFRNHFVNMKGSRFNARSVVQYIKSLSYFQSPVEIVKEIDALLKNELDVVTRFELLSAKANQCILAQNPGEALFALSEALKDKLTNENVNRIYLQNAMIYAYSLNDKSGAEKYFNMLIENSEKNSDYYLVAEEEITNLNKTFSKFSGEYAQTEPVLEPDKYSLLQNYPNPFNPETKIRFNLPEDSQVKLEIYNIQGQRVITLFDKMLPAGIHIATFNGSYFSSGIYFYRLEAGKFNQVKRMLLIR